MTTLHFTWQKALSQAVTNFDALCDLLLLDRQKISYAETAQKSFPLRVPREFIERMEIGNPQDPLFLQVLPQFLETQFSSGFTQDPLNEASKNPIPGLLHKYHGRVLLTLTSACAINCRYCFRRHFPYENNIPGRENWQRIMEYVQQDSSIEEIIFSGGDPLVLKDTLLSDFISQLETISHLKRLRIHTRLPIVIPQRITDEFIQLLSRSHFQKIIVIHCNHVNEINHSVINALQKLRETNMILLNQSVLLKNINDNSDALISLSKKLFEAGVLPYYLHLMDKVAGAAHFDVSEEKAQALMTAMKEKLPGFLVPKLAREIPGMMHKAY